MSKFKVSPPIGFSFASGKNEDVLSEKEVVALVSDLIPTLVKKYPLDSSIKILKENGFTVKKISSNKKK